MMTMILVKICQIQSQVQIDNESAADEIEELGSLKDLFEDSKFFTDKDGVHSMAYNSSYFIGEEQ